MSTENTIGVWGEGHRVYAKSELYDRNSQEPQIGKVLPEVPSLVIDKELNALYDVVSVNKTTREIVLKPVTYVTDPNAVRFVSYGNDRFHLLYDERVDPTLLKVDGKLTFFAPTDVEYRLVKRMTGEEDVVISVHMDSDGNVLGNRVPVLKLNENEVRCAQCYTNERVADGDVIVLEVFDSEGVMSAICHLHCTRASVLNDLSAAANPITAFVATANQEQGTDWVLYLDQPKEHLQIYPELVYENGDRRKLTIDNASTFLFGLEGISEALKFVGRRFPVVIKHFLPPNQPAIGAQGEGQRFVVIENDIVIGERPTFDTSKILVVPTYDRATLKWVLRFFHYNTARSNFMDVTDKVAILSPFSGVVMNTPQTVNFKYSYTTPTGDQGSYTQTVVVILDNPDTAEPYKIKDSTDSVIVYGAITSNLSRPEIYYDSATPRHFISTAKFPSVDKFIEGFYTNISPPRVGNEIEVPAPTHFIVRNVVGQSIVSAPIPIAEYNQNFTLMSAGDDTYVNGNVVVEFLRYENAKYNILFGAPVDVRASAG